MSPYRTPQPNTEPETKMPRRRLSGLARAIVFGAAGFAAVSWPIYGWAFGLLDDTSRIVAICLPSFFGASIIGGILAAYNFFDDAP